VEAYAGDLSSPAEKQFGADVVLLASNVVEGAAVLHQLGDQHQLSGHTDGRDTHTVRVIDRSHDPSLLQQVTVLIGRRALA